MAAARAPHLQFLPTRVPPLIFEAGQKAHTRVYALKGGAAPALSVLTQPGCVKDA